MGNAIREIERLYQEKICLFEELLGIFTHERQAIIRADVSSLWLLSRNKQDVAAKILDIREKIMAVAWESGILCKEDDPDYSMLKIISAIPDAEKTGLTYCKITLAGLKGKISSLTKENRRFLDESLKTIADLVHIITRNCVCDERYSRDNYLRPAHMNSKIYMVGEA